MGQKSDGEFASILAAAREGQPDATQRLFSLVYGELKKIAKNRIRDGPYDAMQTTTVVHEAYLRMVDRQNTSWSDRHHFFWAAARAMKDILVERARYDSAVKRGGRHSRVALDDGLVAEMDPPDLIDLTDALERLAAIHPDAAQILELKFFAGLNREEIGEMMELSPAAVWRKWNFARAWLLNELDGRSPDK